MLYLELIKCFIFDSWLFLPCVRLALVSLHALAHRQRLCDIVRMEQLEMADAPPDASCPSLHSAGGAPRSSTPPPIFPSHPLSFHPYV